MCIVIDSNTLPSVFRSNSSDHKEFEPVKNWLQNGKGKIVYGGTRYKIELRRMPKYVSILAELERGGQIVKIDDASVDTLQSQIAGKLSHPDFDDQHIVALVIQSKCRLVCSKDKKAFRFLKHKDLYPKRFPRPSIYSGSGNSDLLTVCTC